MVQGRLLEMERMGRGSSGEEAAVCGAQALRAVDMPCWPACSDVFKVQGRPSRQERAVVRGAQVLRAVDLSLVPCLLGGPLKRLAQLFSFS